jgi:acyl-CoA reductase-like NAD-dependent aldehyde dehydrogenase
VKLLADHHDLSVGQGEGVQAVITPVTAGLVGVTASAGPAVASGTPIDPIVIPAATAPLRTRIVPPVSPPPVRTHSDPDLTHG